MPVAYRYERHLDEVLVLAEGDDLKGEVRVYQTDDGDWAWKDPRGRTLTRPTLPEAAAYARNQLESEVALALAKREQRPPAPDPDAKTPTQKRKLLLTTFVREQEKS